MGPLMGVALGVAGDLIGSGIQGHFNAKEASKNRNWQEHMSNTAYQRAADDLEAAGLNRVLALGTPSSTPSGATASIEAPKLGQTGIAAASARQHIQLQKAEEKLIGQKQNESESAEALNRVAAITSATQGQLNTSSAAAALANEKLLMEQARKVRIEADRGDVMNPLYQAAGDLVKKIDEKLRSSSRDDGWWPTIKNKASDLFTDDPDSGWLDEARKERQINKLKGRK